MSYLPIYNSHTSNFLILYNFTIFNYIYLVFSSFFFFQKNYLLLLYATSVRLSVRPSVCPSVCPSVRLSSVEIISFHGISISNRPIDLKIGLDVRKGVVHVRKALVFRNSNCKLQIYATCNFLQINLCARF